MKRILPLLLALLALSAPAVAERADVDIGALVPTAHAPSTESSSRTALYCGPTQGAFRRDELTLDTGEPFVYFGQYDCWAMVAQGTPEAFGPVGWVESAAIGGPDMPELSFSDALPVMIEEDTFLTDDPLSDEPPRLMELARGTMVSLLAQYEGWGYVQLDTDDAFIRAFFPLTAI